MPLANFPAPGRWQVRVASNCSVYSKRSASSAAPAPAAPAPAGVATDTRWKFTFPAVQSRSNNLFNSISLPSYVLGMKMSRVTSMRPCSHVAMWPCGMWHQCKKFVPIRGRLVRTVGRLVSPRRRRSAFASSCVNQMFCFFLLLPPPLPPVQRFCSLFLFFSPLWRSSFPGHVSLSGCI